MYLHNPWSTLVTYGYFVCISHWWTHFCCGWSHTPESWWLVRITYSPTRTDDTQANTDTVWERFHLYTVYTANELFAWDNILFLDTKRLVNVDDVLFGLKQAIWCVAVVTSLQNLLQHHEGGWLSRRLIRLLVLLQHFVHLRLCYYWWATAWLWWIRAVKQLKHTLMPYKSESNGTQTKPIMCKQMMLK